MLFLEVLVVERQLQPSPGDISIGEPVAPCE